MPESIVIALIAGGSAVIGGLINQMFNRKKTSADAAATLSSASIELVEALRVEVQELRRETDNLQAEVRELKGEIEALGIVAESRQEQIAALQARLDEAIRINDAQEKRIAHLEQVLRENGIDPPHTREIGGVPV